MVQHVLQLGSYNKTETGPHLCMQCLFPAFPQNVVSLSWTRDARAHARDLACAAAIRKSELVKPLFPSA